MSSTYFERNNTKTNKPTTRTFHLHVGHKPRCKLLASVALVSMENFGNVEVVLLLPGGLRFATWKLQLTPTFLHAHSFSHYQYVKQRRIQVHIVSKFWKKILEVRNRNWYHVIIIINHIYIYIIHICICFFMYFCIKGRRGASLPLSKSLKGRSGTGPTKSFGAGRLEKSPKKTCREWISAMVKMHILWLFSWLFHAFERDMFISFRIPNKWQEVTCWSGMLFWQHEINWETPLWGSWL